jgi:3-oxoadipate enol-lactonase
MPFAESDHAQIHYSLDGQPGKCALVLSNSLGTDFHMWDSQIPEFQKSFRVLRYDTRGHGESSLTPGPYSIEQLGNDVLALADSLKIKSFHFCGLSMGGQIGMWLGGNASQRLKKLVLCSTAAKIGTLETWNTRIETVRTEGMKPVAAAAIDRWFSPTFRQKNPTAIATIQKTLEQTSREGYAANCAAVRDFDFRGQLHQLRTPTLVISGTHDPATPPSDGQFLARNIPSARFVELNAAHLSNIEDAGHFTREVITFLNS